MIDRLSRILVALAQAHAPRALAGDPAPALFARRLADDGVLVLLAHAAPPDADAVVRQWITHCVAAVEAITRAAFPSLTGVQAYYADHEQPAIVFLVGTAAPVVARVGETIIPYAAARRVAPPSDFELNGLLDLVFDLLEAGDLPRESYRLARAEAAAHVRALCALPVALHALVPPHPHLQAAFGLPTLAGDMTSEETDTMPTIAFNTPPPTLDPHSAPTLFGADVSATPDDVRHQSGGVPPAPSSLPEAPAASEPSSLPEAPAASEPSPFASSVPNILPPKRRGKRPPPVPDLPDR